jgi:RNA polymerase sigma factor (sigma-70 family)
VGEASLPSRGDNDLSDIQLVDLLLRGERGAFDLFYHRYGRVIFHCIRARADAVDVPDLFQSFFERLLDRDYRVLKLWNRGASLPLYLSKVIRNFVVASHRAKHWREEAVGGLSDLETVGRPEEETITTAMFLKELRRIGLQAWSKLDNRDRFLVCGKLHRDMSNEAIAQRLGLTDGAVRTALSRAQVRLLAGLKVLAPEYFSIEV